MGRLLLVRPSDVLDSVVDDDLLALILIAALHEEAEQLTAG